MKRFILLLFVAISTFSIAQSTITGIDISLGEKKKDLPIFLSNNMQALYFYTMPSRRDFKILKFSTEMLLLSEIDIKLSPSYEGRVIIEKKIEGNQLHLFSVLSNEDKSMFYSETYNLETRKSNQDEKMTSSVSNWSRGWFTVYSPDSSKFIRFSKFDIQYDKRLNILVFDENYAAMNKKHRFKIHQYDYSYIGGSKGGVMAMYKSFKSAVKVDDKGGVYFLRRVHSENDIKTKDVTAIVNRSPRVRFEKEDQFYSYILYRAVKENNYELEIYPLKAKPGYFLKDAFLSIIGHDSIVVSGLYSKQGDINSAGVFSVIPTFSSKGYLQIENYKEYDAGLPTLYTSEWENGKILKAIGNNDVWDYYNYASVGFVKYKSGYIEFLEQQFSFTVSYNATNHATANQYFNIIGIYISNDGSIKGIIKIPKRQIAVDRAIASLSIRSMDSDHIQFVFNGVDIRKTSSSNSISSYILDGDQKLSFYTLQTKKQYSGFFTFGSQWVKPNLIIGNYSKIAMGKKGHRALISFELGK